MDLLRHRFQQSLILDKPTDRLESLQQCLHVCQTNLDNVSKSWWDYIIYYKLRRELVTLMEMIEESIAMVRCKYKT